MLGHDRAEVVDAGGRGWCRWLSLRDLAVNVATDDERDSLTDRSTFPKHVETGQVLRVEAQLDAATDERWIDGVAIAGQRDRGGAGDAPHDGPAEGLAQD